MADTLASLVVKLSADIAEYQTGIEKAEGLSSNLADGLSKIGGSIVLGGIAAVGAAIGASTAFMIDAVKAAADADKIQAQLINTIATTGSVTGVTVEQVNDLATSFSKFTTFEDDSISAAGEVIARFKEIGSDVFPGAMEATLDLATVMKTDAPQAALLLSKALADPTSGLAKLKMAGVVFTEKEEEMINKMAATGDMAGAQSFILDKLRNSIGGAATAAGMTFSGQMQIMQNTLGNISDTIGAALLPILTDLAYTFTEWVSGPDVQAFIEGIATAVGDFAKSVVGSIPTVLMWFQQAYDWLMNNQGVLVGILAALGVAIGVFVYSTVIPAAISVIAAIAPVIAVLALVALAGYLLYQAWMTDFGGIRTFLIELWTGTLQPIFEQLVSWFQAQLPVAIQFLSGLWVNTLLPAIQQAGMWIQANVIPLLGQLVTWLKTNVPIAIQALSDFWTGVLLPAIQTAWSWMSTVLWPFLVQLAGQIGTAIGQAIQTLSNFWTSTLLPAIQSVWAWMNSTLLPFFTALAQFLSAVLGKAVEAAAGFWQNVLQPALENFYKFVVENVVPVIQQVVEWLGEKLTPVVQTVAKYVGDTLTKAFEGVSQAIQDVTKWLSDMATKISGLSLPDWLTPGSPTPFEIGLRGIASAMDDVTSVSLPGLSQGLDMGNPGISSGRQVVFNMQDTQLSEDQLRMALYRTEALYG